MNEDELAPRRTMTRRPRAFENGIVYFIQEGADGPIKIGTTTISPVFRLSQMQVGNPRKLRLLGYIEGGQDVEDSIHARFRWHRLSGEWFRPMPVVVAFIKEQIAAYKGGAEMRQMETIRTALEARRS